MQSAVMAPDLLYLLEEKGVDEELIAKLLAAGITTVSRLSLLEDTRAGMRKVLETMFQFDPNAPGTLMKQVSIMDAWETAMVNMAEDRKQQAEAKSTRLPRVLPRAQHNNLRKSAEAVYGEIPDRIAPGATYVEAVLEMIEEGTLEAVPLAQVMCVEDGEDMKQGAVIDPSGVVRIRRGRQEVAFPKDTEGLRKRLRTWGFAFTYAKLKHPARGWLSSATPDAIADYSDYILGDTVRGLEAKSQNNEVVARPAWQQILHYDFQVRKEQAKNISKGMGFKEALTAACADYTLRERHFITPMALSAIPSGTRRQRSRTPRRQSSPGSSSGLNSKGSKGGKGKKGPKSGKGKGKGKLRYRTLDDKSIRFAYNNPDENCDGQCGRAHVCRKCLGPHPMFCCGSKGEPKREDR